MNPSAAAEALGSAENKSSSPKSNKDQAESQESNSNVPTIETTHKTRPSLNSDEDGVNSEEEGEIVRKDLRQKSTIFQNGTEMKPMNSSCYPGETVNYSLNGTNGRRGPLGEANSSRHSSASPTPSAPLSPTGPSSIHSDESYAIPTLGSHISATLNSPTPVTPQHHTLYSQYSAPPNRNYNFLAGQTQLDNITRQSQAITISSTENERLRKLKQKKENKEKKKDKNVNVYTIGNGTEPELSVDKILESLGEIKSDKQPSKKSQKATKSSVKQGNATTTEKPKSQRRSFEKNTASLEETNEKDTYLQEGKGHYKQNELENNNAKPLEENQRKSKKDPEKKRKSTDPFYDNPQVQEMLNSSRNIVLVDPDSTSPGDLRKQTSKSMENLFTTVVPKKQKNKKKFPATDADIHTSTGGGMSTNHRSYISNTSQSNEVFRSRGQMKGSGMINGASNNRERGNVANNGAKASSVSANSSALSDTSSTHQEFNKTSNKSAGLNNANNTDFTKYNYQAHQRSTGTSSVASGSLTGESVSEAASLATDLDLATDFPPLGLNDSSTTNNSGNGQNMSTGEEHPTTLKGNRAPLPKAVWPIVRSNVSTSDSTAVIENNITNKTNMNENVNNNASENNNSNNAVVSLDVSLSSISTSSVTTASSSVTVSNMLPSQPITKSAGADSSNNKTQVAQRKSAPTVPSYSSALLGHNNNHFSANQPNQLKQTPNPPEETAFVQNAMLIESNPPDITVDTSNVPKPQASLPDVTAQAPFVIDSTERYMTMSNEDSENNSVQPFHSLDPNAMENSVNHSVVSATDEYTEGFDGPAMQINNNHDDSIPSAMHVETSSPSSCFYVDDNKDVAIVLNETAYYSYATSETKGLDLSISTENITNDIESTVPAVTILGRGETPVADWSSKCDGLEFGGPVNEDLLSMEYVTPVDIRHQINNYIQPHEPFYQPMVITNVINTGAAINQSHEIENNETLAFETDQINNQNAYQEEQVPLPAIDGAILSFGECLEQGTVIDPFEIDEQNLDTNNTELNINHGPSNKLFKDNDISFTNASYTNLSMLKVNTNIQYSEAMCENPTKNAENSALSLHSISPNSSEENNPQYVPLNNELDNFSATKWANQVNEKLNLETESPVIDQTQSSSFIENNMVYNANPAITDANNKVNYNYQEILSFVSNSWQQMEKELTSGAKGKYYYSKAASNNKPNSGIAKFNNSVQKQ